MCLRELGAETSPMLGIRASASGRYLLVLLRGAPSEIWQVHAFPCWLSVYGPYFEPSHLFPCASRFNPAGWIEIHRKEVFLLLKRLIVHVKI